MLGFDVRRCVSRASVHFNLASVPRWRAEGAGATHWLAGFGEASTCHHSCSGLVPGFCRHLWGVGWSFLNRSDGDSRVIHSK